MRKSSSYTLIVATKDLKIELNTYSELEKAILSECRVNHDKKFGRNLTMVSAILGNHSSYETFDYKIELDDKEADDFENGAEFIFRKMMKRFDKYEHISHEEEF